MAGAQEVRTRKILVAVDESEESTYALSWCLKNVVSPQFRDTIILLYAQPVTVSYSAFDAPGFMFSSEMIVAMEKYATEVAKTIIERAKKACAEVAGDVVVETAVEKGDAREVICQAVKKFSADLLVMGSHGYGVIKRTFLGSVSNHCAQSVQCPVLIAKTPKSMG